MTSAPASKAALTPAKALTISDDDLRHTCGFSYRKAGYLKHLAAIAIGGRVIQVPLSTFH
jgi:3-methyladenine DNA glycosylase/8-oxoguanine DNA glycosylase